jgi:hypothetical protein
MACLARVALLSSLVLLACRDRPKAPEPQPRVPQSREPQALGWGEYRDACVVLEGYVGGEKIGPRLAAGARSIALRLDTSGEQAWNALPAASRVRVRGVVRERADLPVFVVPPDGPVEQGIPVPEGTDLEKARRRYVLEEAQVTLLRPPTEVSANLQASIGTDVVLGGIVWSKNGQFWLNHEGVDVHLEGDEALWNRHHGDVVTVRGRLDRRPLPRIDQIALKDHPDVTDAFVVVVSAGDLAPTPLVSRCTAEE